MDTVNLLPWKSYPHCWWHDYYELLRRAGGCQGTSGGGEGIVISRAVRGRYGKRSLSNGVGKGVFLMRPGQDMG